MLLFNNRALHLLEVQKDKFKVKIILFSLLITLRRMFPEQINILKINLKKKATLKS